MDEPKTDPERDDDRPERDSAAGAYEWAPLLDPERQPPPDEFTNPSGVSRGACDDEAAAEKDETCSIEATAQSEDLFLEETKPGYGIPGFEGEEDGGG